MGRHENTLPVSVDYVRPMSNGRLEIGAKVQFRWIPVTYLTEPGFMSIIYAQRRAEDLEG